MRQYEAKREKLAEYAHEAWSGWMLYLFSKCDPQPDGEMVIPKWAVDRWMRQMKTVYKNLPESEKESDRKEADRMLEIIHESEKEPGTLKDITNKDLPEGYKLKEGDRS